MEDRSDFSRGLRDNNSHYSFTSSSEFPNPLVNQRSEATETQQPLSLYEVPPHEVSPRPPLPSTQQTAQRTSRTALEAFSFPGMNSPPGHSSPFFAFTIRSIGTHNPAVSGSDEEEDQDSRLSSETEKKRKHHKVEPSNDQRYEKSSHREKKRSEYPRNRSYYGGFEPSKEGGVSKKKFESSESPSISLSRGSASPNDSLVRRGRYDQTPHASFSQPPKRFRQESTAARAHHMIASNLCNFDLSQVGIIRFSHPYVSFKMDSGNYNIERFKEEIVKAKKWNAHQPIEVVQMPDGGLTSLDNRRLTALHQAASELPLHEKSQITFTAKVWNYRAEAPRPWIDRISAQWDNHVVSNEQESRKEAIKQAAEEHRIDEGTMGYLLLTRVQQYNSLKLRDQVPNIQEFIKANQFGYDKTPIIETEERIRQENRISTASRLEDEPKKTPEPPPKQRGAPSQNYNVRLREAEQKQKQEENDLAALLEDFEKEHGKNEGPKNH